jgi:RNA polymerase sigma factor (sigma-70 family)
VYLRRAVINLCRTGLKRRYTEARVNRTVHDREAAPSGWSDSENDFDHLIWDAVRELPPRQRACVVLRYFEDLPDAEIAEILHCSTGTVKSQLHKARATLEASLGRSLSGESHV